MLRKGDLARGQATSMTAVRDDADGGGWHRLGVVAPEGHNVFLPSTALEKALPADVYRQMLAEFDAQYSSARRCDSKQRVAARAGDLDETYRCAGRRGFARRGRYRRTLWQWPRFIGLSIGIVPFFLMTLHNWVFGHVFVLFSANAQHSDVLVMPPSAYAGAAREFLSLDVYGAFLERLVRQIASWLSGPVESFATIPLNAAGVALLIYVVFRGRQFDPWLRLVGASALAQHAVALFYTAAIARYHFLAWFLTMLVVMVWLQQLGVVWMKRRYPALSEQFIANPLCRRLASWLARLQKVSA